MQSHTTSRQQPHITELFVQKILAYLDNNDVNKLNDFLKLFGNCKIVFNSTPVSDAMSFLTMWQQQVVSTQHSLTSLDYHVIPGSGTLLCNVNARVRFDESGRDKQGQDALVVGAGAGGRSGPGSGGSNVSNRSGSAGSGSRRPLWGSYFGVSLQLVIDDRIYRNDFNGVITGFNYKIVFKPEDSLMVVV